MFTTQAIPIGCQATDDAMFTYGDLLFWFRISIVNPV